MTSETCVKPEVELGLRIIPNLHFIDQKKCFSHLEFWNITFNRKSIIYDNINRVKILVSNEKFVAFPRLLLSVSYVDSC